MQLGDSGEAYFLTAVEDTDDDDLDSVEELSSDSADLNQGSTENVTLHSGHERDQPKCDNKENVCPDPETSADSCSVPITDSHVLPVASSFKTEPAQSSVAQSHKNSNGHKRVRRKKKSKLSINSSRSINNEPSTRLAIENDEEPRGNKDGQWDKSPSSISSYPLYSNDDLVHPHSDSELSEPINNCHHTHISDIDGCKSDSEYEIIKQIQSSKPDDQITWNWGELPQNPKKKESAASTSKAVVDNAPNVNNKPTSVLSGVFNFMGKNNGGQNDDDKGIYLDDLDPENMNPDIAAQYFSKYKYPSNMASDARLPLPYSKSLNTSDDESGTGQSLGTSLNTSEDFIDRLGEEFKKKISESQNDPNCDISEVCRYYDMSMSLCGGIETLDSNPNDTERFLESLVCFDDFSKDPLKFVEDPNLIIRMGGRYYNWKMACPILLSLLMFQRGLPERTMDFLRNQCVPKKSAQKSKTWGFFSFRGNTADGTSEKSVASSPVRDSSLTASTPVPTEQVKTNSLSSEPSDALNAENITQLDCSRNNRASISEDELNTSFAKSDLSLSKTSLNSSLDISITIGGKKKKFRKMLRLTNELIQSLNLKPHANDIKFSVTTAYQGTSSCESKIFLWRYDDKIVISDIDGTITKSDVLGHILPYIGRDWAQLGVTNLFTQIENNGYHFVYLSARAIGQAKATRDYLRSVRQDEETLPDGPVLLSPTSLFSAFHREVIEKKPEEFKISCLKDIASLFPSNPFFAGFGNKINVSKNCIIYDQL